MLGHLDENQIEDLLKRNVTGRIGCHADGTTYIVPINYFYKNNIIYGHSAPGQKIDMMRKNHNVCFQVDEIESIFRWQSVLAWGNFEEITDPEKKQQAMQGITHRIMPLVTTAAGHVSHGITADERAMGNTLDLIVYKITLHKKTGRFEDE